MSLCPEEIAEPKKAGGFKIEPPLAHSSSTPPQPPRVRRFFTIVALTAIALVLGLGFWTLSRRLAPEITAPASAESAYVASFPEKSIAVLPFADLSEGKQDTSLADGMQDDILTALSKVADLRVISRTSASTYSPDKARDLREIAQNLGVAYVLEGHVRRTDDRVSITAQLT